MISNELGFNLDIKYTYHNPYLFYELLFIGYKKNLCIYNSSNVKFIYNQKTNKTTHQVTWYMFEDCK